MVYSKENRIPISIYNGDIVTALGVIGSPSDTNPYSYTLVIDQDITIPDQVVEVPSNVAVQVIPGNYITVPHFSGTLGTAPYYLGSFGQKYLKFNGPFIAERTKVFKMLGYTGTEGYFPGPSGLCNSLVYFSPINSLYSDPATVYPEWFHYQSWNGGYTEWGVAIQHCLNSISQPAITGTSLGGTIKLGRTQYKMTTPLVIQSDTTIEGEGITVSNIYWRGSIDRTGADGYYNVKTELFKSLEIQFNPEDVGSWITFYTIGTNGNALTGSYEITDYVDINNIKLGRVPTNGLDETNIGFYISIPSLISGSDRNSSDGIYNSINGQFSSASTTFCQFDVGSYIAVFDNRQYFNQITSIIDEHTVTLSSYYIAGSHTGIHFRVSRTGGGARVYLRKFRLESSVPNQVFAGIDTSDFYFDMDDLHITGFSVGIHVNDTGDGCSLNRIRFKQAFAYADSYGPGRDGENVGLWIRGSRSTTVPSDTTGFRCYALYSDCSTGYLFGEPTTTNTLSTGSGPNEIELFGCMVDGCHNVGLDIYQGGNISWFGGRFELSTAPNTALGWRTANDPYLFNVLIINPHFSGTSGKYWLNEGGQVTQISSFGNLTSGNISWNGNRIPNCGFDKWNNGLPNGSWTAIDGIDWNSTPTGIIERGYDGSHGLFHDSYYAILGNGGITDFLGLATPLIPIEYGHNYRLSYSTKAPINGNTYEFVAKFFDKDGVDITGRTCTDGYCSKDSLNFNSISANFTIDDLGKNILIRSGLYATVAYYQIMDVIDEVTVTLDKNPTDWTHDISNVTFDIIIPGITLVAQGNSSSGGIAGFGWNYSLDALRTTDIATYDDWTQTDFNLTISSQIVSYIKLGWIVTGTNKNYLHLDNIFFGEGQGPEIVNKLLHSKPLLDTGTQSLYGDLVIDGYLTVNKRITEVLTSDALVINGINLVDPTAGGFTLTLPPAANYKYSTITVKNVSISTNTVRLQASGLETIDGNSYYDMNTSYEAQNIFSDGTQWLLI